MLDFHNEWYWIDLIHEMIIMIIVIWKSEIWFDSSNKKDEQ